MQTRKSSPTFYQNKVDGCDGFSAFASNTCINLCNAQGSFKKVFLAHGRTVCKTLVQTRMSTKNNVAMFLLFTRLLLNPHTAGSLLCEKIVSNAATRGF